MPRSIIQICTTNSNKQSVYTYNVKLKNVYMIMLGIEYDKLIALNLKLEIWLKDIVCEKSDATKTFAIYDNNTDAMIYISENIRFKYKSDVIAFILVFGDYYELINE